MIQIKAIGRFSEEGKLLYKGEDIAPLSSFAKTHAGNNVELQYTVIPDIDRLEQTTLLLDYFYYMVKSFQGAYKEYITIAEALSIIESNSKTYYVSNNVFGKVFYKKRIDYITEEQELLEYVTDIYFFVNGRYKVPLLTIQQWKESLKS